MANLLNPSNVHWIVLHTTDSWYGDVQTIDRWHRERGFDGIGYHWLITGIYPTYESWMARKPDLNYDGLIHRGRSEAFQGAHVKGHNWESIGIAMVGKGGIFSAAQLRSTARITRQVLHTFPNIIGIKAHHDFDPNKDCPDFDVEFFRKYILHGDDDENDSPIHGAGIPSCL